MKNHLFLLMAASFSLFTQPLSAQTLVRVNRWVSPVVGDFVSVPESLGNDQQMASWGYKGKILQYEAFLTHPGGDNITAVYRWEMPKCKEFIVLAEHEHSDEQLRSWGYTNKQFMFYAYRTPPSNEYYVEVSRWVNALPQGNACRDFTLSVTTQELSDEQLLSWGYSAKKVQFYALDPKAGSYPDFRD